MARAMEHSLLASPLLASPLLASPFLAGRPRLASDMDSLRIATSCNIAETGGGLPRRTMHLKAAAIPHRSRRVRRTPRNYVHPERPAFRSATAPRPKSATDGPEDDIRRRCGPTPVAPRPSSRSTQTLSVP